MLIAITLVVMIILPVFVAFVATVLLEGLPGRVDDANLNQVFPWPTATNGCVE